jgi:hypothetical protein
MRRTDTHRHREREKRWPWRKRGRRRKGERKDVRAAHMRALTVRSASVPRSCGRSLAYACRRGGRRKACGFSFLSFFRDGTQRDRRAAAARCSEQRLRRRGTTPRAPAGQISGVFEFRIMITTSCWLLIPAATSACNCNCAIATRTRTVNVAGG